MSCCADAQVVRLALSQCSLRARGSRLLLLQGRPQEVFPRIFKVGPLPGVLPASWLSHTSGHQWSYQWSYQWLLNVPSLKQHTTYPA